jgi:hypothetical protein
MNSPVHLIIASALTLLLAAIIAGGITLQKNAFNAVACRTIKNTEGYDKKFIAMVTELEKDLAIKARFGYSGKKDPMTGRMREVVVPRPVSQKAKARSPARASEPVQYSDPVQLTAIIYDERSRHTTAIIMVNERSISIEVGDKVLDRTVTEITKQMVFMESPTKIYRYDILGEQTETPK